MSDRIKALNELATVQLSTGGAQIKRENLQTTGVATARLRSGGPGTVMKTIRKDIKSLVYLPSGYYRIYGRSYAEQQQSFKELLLILISSSLLVFGVILFLFRDFRIALLTLIIAVLGISGSYIGLYLTGTPLNVGSYTGLITIV